MLIGADNLFSEVALIGGRLTVFFGVDLPFDFAHRFFTASEIRLRAAELIVRLRGLEGLNRCPEFPHFPITNPSNPSPKGCLFGGRTCFVQR